MRLTKLEKTVNDLIAEGYRSDAIAAVLKIKSDELSKILRSINEKYDDAALKEARRKYIIKNNRIRCPQLSGLLECVNLDRPNPQYWLFEGSQENCVHTQGELANLGIAATVKQNGNNGSFLLIVPIWVTGVLFTSTEENHINSNFNKEEGDTNHVNNSITATATETGNPATNCFESGFEHVGIFQRQDIECAA